LLFGTDLADQRDIAVLGAIRGRSDERDEPSLLKADVAPQVADDFLLDSVPAGTAGVGYPKRRNPGSA
jgi:hypothetical protein